MQKALMRGMNWVSKEDIAPVQNKRFLIISGINDGAIGLISCTVDFVNNIVVGSQD